ncbi:MAG: HAMP domain-containing histidine kinase [Bdellovibrio sp.]|nr:HAMP domain-containing histidine kinase [Bdellovibrio sp.]
MLFGLSKRIRSSISLRIAFLFCATFAVGLAIAFLVTYFELTYSLERSSREILSSKLQEAKTLVSTDGIPGLRHFLAIEKNRILNAPFLFRVLNVDGETLYLKPSIQETQFDFENAFNTKIDPVKSLGWQSLSAIDDEDKFNILTERTDADLFLQVGRSSEEREGLLEEILLNFAIIEVILVFMSAFFGIWYARKSLAPLRELLKTILLIEKGNLSQRVPAGQSEDELRDLGETFNRMIARIEKLIQVMHESLDNVAHDIRTPLTRIRAVAEDALLSKNPPQLKEALEDCAEGATNIADLVDQLLSISEAESGEMKLRLELCDIKNLLTEVVEIYDFVAIEKEITMTVATEPDHLEWMVDRKRMKQATANLLDNAIKFSGLSTKVSLQAKIDRNELVISVTDQGEGILDADIPRIWDRLFRADKSRATKGLGLGLSIVRSVAIAHHGRYQVVNNKPRGTTFSIFIPKP